MRREDRNLFMVSILALIWVIIAFLGYIYIHKPFSAIQLLGLLRAGWQILVVAGMLSLAGGIGMLTRLRALDVPPLTRAVLTGALGLGLLSIVVLLVGATIGINVVLWVLMVAAGILLRRQILFWWRSWREAANILRETGKLGRIIFGFVAAILFCQLLFALAPPLRFDTLTYHLAIPEELIRLGRIAYLPDNMEWGNARQAEMLYIPAMWMAGAETPAVLGWALGVMTLLALAELTGRIFNRDSGWVAVASVMCGPALAGLLSSAYADWEAMLFALAMLICLVQWTLKRDAATLCLAGLFAGMAFSTKYTAGLVLIPAVAVILFFHRPSSLKNTAGNLALFGATSLAISLPWLLKNALATSNPFYPLFIPGGAMDATRLAFYQMKPLPDWSRLALLPWQITVWGSDGSSGFAASIGPLLLGLSPLAFIHLREYDQIQRRTIAIGAMLVLITFLIWGIGSQFSFNLMETRYYFPSFTAWALLCAGGYFTISRIHLPGVRINILFAALILLALGFNVFATLTTTLASNPLLAVLGLETPQTYLADNLGGYELAMQTLQALPEKSHVLMLWEARGFECLPKCDSDEIIDRWHYDWSVYGSPDRIIQAWRQQGYTQILLNRTGIDFIQTSHPDDPNAPSPASWDGLNRTLASLAFIQSVGGYDLYSIP